MGCRTEESAHILGSDRRPRHLNLVAAFDFGWPVGCSCISVLYEVSRSFASCSVETTAVRTQERLQTINLLRVKIGSFASRCHLLCAKRYKNGVNSPAPKIASIPDSRIRSKPHEGRRNNPVSQLPHCSSRPMLARIML